MRKNQKYTKEEMYLAVELCKESNMTQNEFCKKEGLALGTFKYWQRKYQEQHIHTGSSKSSSFIPIEVAAHDTEQTHNNDSGYITISYPNGIQVSCPVNISDQQLKALIKS